MWGMVKNLLTARGLVLAAVLAVLGVANFWLTRDAIRTDRQNLEQQFSHDRVEQLAYAVERVEHEFGEILDDLELARDLIGEGRSLSERRELLAAFLTGARPYSAIALFDAEARPLVRLESARTEVPLPAELGDVLAEAVQELLEGPGSILVTSALDEPPRDQGARHLRIFLRHFADGITDSEAVVAIVVDTTDAMMPLEVVTSDRHAALLLTRPEGTPIAPSNAELVDALEAGAEDLQPLLDALESQEAGFLSLSGLPNSVESAATTEAVAVHQPVRIGGDLQWMASTLTSMLPIRKRKTLLVWRLTITSGFVGLILVGMGVFTLIHTRRQAVLNERLEVAEEVVHLHEKANKILESIPTGIMLVAEDGRVTQLNRALRGELSAERDDPTVDELFAGAPAAERRRLEELIEEACADGAIRAIVDERSGLFGEEGQFRIQAVPLESTAPDERALVVFDDFSQLHRLEMQLVRAEKLASVGTLAAGIAHEVGTPLGVIRGRAEILQYKLDEDSPAQESLEIIIDQIDRVSRIIRGLLDFSRAEEPDAGAVDLAESVSAVIDLLRFEFERNDIAVDVSIPEGLAPLEADRDHLQQVLLNLLVNAIDASSGGDRILVTARRVQDRLADAQEVLVVIEDQGCGIPEERIHQVFDPFFTTKKRGEGTGLGLSIVGQLVRAHGGRIDIESELGEGTRVILRWPSRSSGEESVDEP